MIKRIGRRKFILLYVLAVTLLSLTVLGLSKWLIVPTVSKPVDHTIADTSPAFTDKTDFNGTVQTPALNSIGEAIYGKGFDDYSIEWVSGTYAAGGNISAQESNAHKAVAGTHYYKITDNTTGQVIAENHAYVINPDVFCVSSVSKPEPAFEGDKLTWTITLTSKNMGVTKTVTHTLDAIAENSYAYDTTTKSVVSSKSKTEYLAGNTVTTDGSYNNYSLEGINTTDYTGVNRNNYTAEGVTYTLEYDILPTCYNGSGSTVTAYYGNLTKAIKLSTSGTIYAMPTVTYNSKTYKVTTGKDANGKDNGHYKHVITETCTIASGVTLNIPYTMDYADAGFEDGLKEVQSQIKVNPDFTGLDLENATSDQINERYQDAAVAAEEKYQSTLKLQNNVVVASGKTLTNKGKIIVAGVVNAGQQNSFYNSITSGDYAQITLASKAILKTTNGATIDCYGFIREEVLNNNSEVIMESGTLMSVFSITEHRGGGAYLGMTDITGESLTDALEDSISITDLMAGRPMTSTLTPGLVCFPFNRFYVQSVSPKMTVKSEASVLGYVNLYANNEYNLTHINLIGSENSSLIQLKESTSKVVHKYDPETRKHDVDVHGSATVNPMVMSLTIQETAASITVSITVNLSTSEILFPISHHWDISFNKSDSSSNQNFVDMSNQKIKILPGGSVTIGEGVTVTANEIAVYADNELLNLNHSTTYSSAYPNTSSGVLQLAGNLTVNRLGGYVDVGSSNASLRISVANTVVSPELYCTEMTTMTINPYNAGIVKKSLTYYEATFTNNTVTTVNGATVDASYNQKSTKTAKGDVAIDAATSEIAVIEATKTYESLQLELATEDENDPEAEIQYEYALIYPNITITFNANGGTVSPSQLTALTGADGLAATAFAQIEATVPTKANYKFVGWYLDQSLQTKLDSNTASGVKFDTTLYAKWELSMNATVVFNLNYSESGSYSGNPVTVTVTSTGISQADLEKINQIIPERLGYDFLGWYIDDACSTLVSRENVTEDKVNNNILNVYAGWEEQVGEPCEITLVINNDNASTLPTTVIAIEGSTYTPKFTFGDSDPNSEFYLLGWSDTADSNTVKKSFTVTKGLTLYAVWGTKTAVTFVMGNDSSTEYHKAQSTITLPQINTGYQKTWIDSAGAVCGAPGDEYTVPSSNVTLSVLGYTITYNANGGTCSTASQTYAGTALTLPTPSRTGHKFIGWYKSASGGTKFGDAGSTFVPTESMTLYAHWEKIPYTITVSTDNATVSGVTNGQTAYYGDTITFTVSYSGDSNKTTTVKDANGNTVQTTGSYTFTMPASNVTISASSSCITPDTLITLADGTQKRVDELIGDELLLVWNLETGSLDYAPIMFVDSEAEEEFEIIHLYFSDGTDVKVIYEHGFWDYDLNKYVYLDRYAAKYIGHSFAKQNGDSLERVQLVDVVLEREVTTAWSPVTVGHLCYFVNGMLSMPGGVGGLFNIFDVDAETMTYDYEAMERDIAKYGLYTYEEINAIAPLSREMFEAAGGAYLKISIGKGNLTEEELIYMIERYSKYFE